MHERIVPVWERAASRPDQPSGSTWLTRPVHVDVEQLGIASSGELLSLSATGARITLDTATLILSTASITIGFQVDSTLYLLCGLTQRSNRDASINFEFDFVTRERVAALMAAGLLQPDQPPPVAKPRPAATKAEQEAQAWRELRTVRHEPPPGGIERRRQSRYDLDAKAALTVLQTDKRMAGELLEISSTGCRIFTEEPNLHPVRTPVEVQFVGLGLPLRLSAEIQINRAEHVAGLIFKDVRPWTQERLHTLLEDLAERDERLLGAEALRRGQ